MNIPLLIVVFLLYCTNLMADEVAELTDLLAGRKTFIADFDQITLSADGNVIQNQSGKLTVAKSNKFRWQVYQPLPQLIVSDGTNVYVYDEELDQVTVMALDADSLDTPAQLLSGNPDKIADNFHVEKIAYAQTIEFMLTPLAAENVFEKLTLGFENRQLDRLEMADSLGQKSIVLFKNARVNEPVDGAVFQFDIPENTDVFYNR